MTSHAAMDMCIINKPGDTLTPTQRTCLSLARRRLQIMSTGAAAKTNLRLGDRIQRVNGKDIRTATHQEAVMALIAPTQEIVLDIRHDPQPPGLQVRVLVHVIEHVYDWLQKP